MRIPYLTFLLSAVTVIIAAIPGLADALTLSRDGAIWQHWTSHFCHWSSGHLFWDLVVFVVLGAWVELRSRKIYALLLIAGLPFLAWSAFALTPAIDEYRGLSGLDSALFGLAALAIWNDARSSYQHCFSILALVAFAAKSIVELFLDAPVFVQDLGESVVGVPAIHLTGVSVGLLFGAGGLLLQNRVLSQECIVSTLYDYEGHLRLSTKETNRMAGNRNSCFAKARRCVD